MGCRDAAGPEMNEPLRRGAQAGRPSASLVRVLIADDHAIVRETLRMALERLCGFKVVAEAADGVAAVELTSTMHPDLVLMDIDMPRMSGIEATRRIVQADPRAKVVGLSVHSTADMGQAMLDAGASGYVSKTDDIRETCRQVKSIMSASYAAPT